MKAEGLKKFNENKMFISMGKGQNYVENQKEHQRLSMFWSTKKTISTFWKKCPVVVLKFDVPTPSHFNNLKYKNTEKTKYTKNKC